MKKSSVRSLAVLCAATGLGGFLTGGLPAAEKWLADPVPVQMASEETAGPADAANTENTGADAGSPDAAADSSGIMPGNVASSSQSYQVVIESKMGSDGKRVQTKKVWKDGVLVENEEKTVEGADADGDTAIELDGQIAPGIILRSERSGAFPFGGIDPNQDQMMQQMRRQMDQIRKRQEEMMRQFGFGTGMPGFFEDEGAFAPNPGQTGANPGWTEFVPSTYWLGAQVSPIAEPVRHQLGLAEDEGIWVVSVVPGSPAEKAGLQEYDILVKLGGQVINDRAQIGQILDDNGDKPLAVEYIRQGKRETKELTPEKRPGMETFPAAGGTDAPGNSMTGNSITGNSGTPDGFGPDEKIRVVRPGMIVPAENGPAENAPAESTENAAPAAE